MTTYQISDVQLDELKQDIVRGGKNLLVMPASTNFRCTLSIPAWPFAGDRDNYYTESGITLVESPPSPLQKALNLLNMISWRDSAGRTTQNRSSLNMWDAILSIMEMASEKTDHIKVLTDEVGTMVEMQLNRLYELALHSEFENPEEEERSVLASFVHRIRTTTERNTQ